jgi:phage-related protein
MATKKQIVITAQANEFIFAQPITVISRFMNLIKTLESDGRIVPPDGKKIDDDLFEMRVKAEGNQYRTFYCYAIDDIIYILSGFVKKTQKTPLNEIKKAHRIMKGLGL